MLARTPKGVAAVDCGDQIADASLLTVLIVVLPRRSESPASGIGMKSALPPVMRSPSGGWECGSRSPAGVAFISAMRILGLSSTLGRMTRR
jgi:hypothetical protein